VLLGVAIWKIVTTILAVALIAITTTTTINFQWIDGRHHS
jgi:hypothetical protein